jgi:methionine synthase II (cobalamin-independent)
MTLAQKNIQIKKSQHRMVTMVTSVEGKSLKEVAPGLINKFKDNVDAIKQIQGAIQRVPANVKTERISLATWQIRN